MFILVAALLSATPAVDAQKEKPMSFHELKTNNLDGTPANLAQYKGKVLLVVNTASECGNTPQYEGLEKLHQELKGKGLEVLGFPSNDFGGQEPGSAAEIRKFCTLQYKVTFPLFEKVKTKGEGQSPVYAFLTKDHGEPKWNFDKYLVGKDGKVKLHFKAKVQPDDRDLRAAIDAALKE
jgi:glutathione peroxidase